MRHISIKRKLMLITMTATTVALLLIAAGFVVYEFVTLKHSMERDLFTQARMIGDVSAATVRFNDDEKATEMLGTLNNLSHIRAAAIYQGTNLFARYPAKAIPAVFPAKPEAGGWRKFDFNAGSLALCEDIKSASGETIGTIWIESDLSEIYDRLERHGTLFVLFIFATLGITYFISRGLQQSISEPILQLAHTARAVSAKKNYTVRAPKSTDGEIGELVDGFNEMLTQIQQRDAALHQVNDELEKRVQERTQDLQLEIAERRRAESALQEQFTRTTLLNHITHAISERQDLESVLYVVLRQLEDHLGIDLGVVCLFERATETLNVAAMRLKNPMLAGKLDLYEGMVMSLEQTGLRVCKHGEAVVTPDTYKSPALLSEKLAAAGFRSCAAVPLLVENRLFGTLIVSRLGSESMSPSECEFLFTLSEHVALAAHQAQLHAELEKAYNELRQTQQAVMQQERLKALGQMASGIAHDINNALSPIVGFADLLMRAEIGNTPNGKKYLQYIKTAGEDIAHIVARLREFYRQRSTHEPVQAFNLNDLARQVVDMTRPRWRDIPQSRGIMIELHTDFEPEQPELVGIQSEIREALTNLILNAVDAIPQGGAIVVRTRMTGCDREDGAPTSIVLEVGDNGVGMNEETRKRCLEPFFSTKGQRGTGLGLAMVYGVMERHEGRIEIHSEVGRGTLMRLVFPIRRAAGAGTPEPVREQAPAPLRILCVDDEPLLRELLREILARDGHQVILADGGEAGVAEFRAAQSRNESFDVVFTDLGMPYFDGRQVAEFIKQESPGTPVVMLTGWGSFMKEDGEVPSHVDGILSKPPRSNELRAMIRRISRKRPGSSPANGHAFNEAVA